MELNDLDNKTLKKYRKLEVVSEMVSHATLTSLLELNHRHMRLDHLEIIWVRKKKLEIEKKEAENEEVTEGENVVIKTSKLYTFHVLATVELILFFEQCFFEAQNGFHLIKEDNQNLEKTPKIKAKMQTTTQKSLDFSAADKVNDTYFGEGGA